ncbi:MAG: glycerol-3-phosphate dehydrogenase/oxidase [Xanthomonadales bacterium]|nr:glycerol-3-phosphate dehydrogenase/oxidase [Xanthomonadales bacterium]
MEPGHSLTDRDALWRELATDGARPWDLIVIGGGITGAGILREAVRRGYRALLLEQRDFCWGTSSRSSKLVHGGLRYLAGGQIRLTRHALLERERLLREAPYLVRRVPFYYPLRRGVFPPRFAAAVLFWLYDRLAGIDDHRRVEPDELRELFPGLDPAGLTGAYRYTDAITDDARLVLRILHDAVTHGAVVRNYSEVTRLLREPPAEGPGRVRGVRVEDAGSGAALELEAAVVINATGAWADRFDSTPPDDLRIHPQRGSHLVLDAHDFPAPAAIFLHNPEDGRRLFAYPWQGRTVIGTTDLPHEQGLEAPACITPAEFEYLLRAAARLYADRPPTPDDVIATWSGIRPIIAAGPVGRPSGASREHRVWSEPGLVSCSGGKLSTFHHMALDVMERAAVFLPPPRNGHARDSRVLDDTGLRPEDLPGLAPERATTLIGRFGRAAAALAASAAGEDLQPLGDSDVCPAELSWSLRREAVVHLDDLLLRRSRLGVVMAKGGAALLNEVRDICMRDAGWDDARWSYECERYRDIIARYYPVPEKDVGVQSRKDVGVHS